MLPQHAVRCWGREKANCSVATGGDLEHRPANARDGPSGGRQEHLRKDER